MSWSWFERLSESALLAVEAFTEMICETEEQG